MCNDGRITAPPGCHGLDAVGRAKGDRLDHQSVAGRNARLARAGMSGSWSDANVSKWRIAAASAAMQ